MLNSGETIISSFNTSSSFCSSQRCKTFLLQPKTLHFCFDELFNKLVDFEMFIVLYSVMKVSNKFQVFQMQILTQFSYWQLHSCANLLPYFLQQHFQIVNSKVNSISKLPEFCKETLMRIKDHWSVITMRISGQVFLSTESRPHHLAVSLPTS